MGIDFLLRWSPIPSLLVDVQGKDTKIWLVLDWKSTMDLGWSCDEGWRIAEVVWCVAIEWCFQPIVVYDQSSIGARGKPIVVWGVNQYETVAESMPSILCAKALHAQLPDISLRSAAQALRLIARIPLIQRRKKRLHVVVFFYLCT